MLKYKKIFLLGENTIMNIKERAKSILNTMTLEEKLGQLNMVCIDPDLEKTKDLIRGGKVGSVIMAGSVIPTECDIVR